MALADILVIFAATHHHRRAVGSEILTIIKGEKMGWCKLAPEWITLILIVDAWLPQRIEFTAELIIIR